MKAKLAPGERVDDLGHGGLRILQSEYAPRFSIDAVLLADFAMVRPGETAADLGCGTGVISLLLAAKQSACRLVALELMPVMAELARRSVELNSLSQQISVINGDIADAPRLLGEGQLEAVISNPPYYKLGHGRQNADPLVAAARSECFCPLAVLLDSAAALLRPRGRLYLVHRANRLAELTAGLEQRGLRLSLLRPVQPYAGKPANLILLRADKGGRGGTEILPPLLVYDQPGIYSAEMERIYDRNPLPGGNAHR